MFKMKSLTGRVFVGKVVGLVVGLIVMVFLPMFGYPIFSMVGFGTLLMFILMGAMTGFMGIFDRHPIFDFKMPWWLRGALVGIAFMLMYILLNFDELENVMESALISWMGLKSPFWALIDGVFIGGIMSYAEDKIAGKGKDLPVA